MESDDATILTRFMFYIIIKETNSYKEVMACCDDYEYAVARIELFRISDPVSNYYLKEYQMLEANLSTCRKCNEIKLRVHAGNFDPRNKKFVDEDGKLWSGRYCPSCNKARVREQMAKNRLAKKAALPQDPQV